MRFVIAGSLVGMLLLRTVSSLACAKPSTTYSVADYGPTEAAELNAPLLVQFAQSDHNEQGIEQELEPTLELRVAGSEELLEVIQGVQLGSLISFAPKMALKSDTKYTASASLVSASSELLGVEKKVWDFTTSEELRPPMILSSEWQVSFEAGVDEEYECTEQIGNCGPACAPVGQVAVTKARLTLPSVSGGFVQEHLSGTVAVTRKGAAEAAPLGVFPVSLEPGKPGAAVFTLPLIEGEGYTPCFELDVRDARSDHETSSFCAEEPFRAPEPPHPVDPADPRPDPGNPPISDYEPQRPEVIRDPDFVPPTTDADDQGARTNTRTSSSCAMSSAPGSSPAWLVAAGAFATLALRRRKSR